MEVTTIQFTIWLILTISILSLKDKFAVVLFGIIYSFISLTMFNETTLFHTFTFLLFSLGVFLVAAINAWRTKDT